MATSLIPWAWRQRIGYGLADFGCNLVWQILTIYQLFFYTDILQFTALQTAYLLLITRSFDAVAGLLLGFVIDRTQSRWGKSRPYFLWGALPFTIFSILMFYTPPFSNQGKFIFALLTYAGLSLSYTMVNMPLTSILPNLTKDPHERVALATSRLVCAFCGAALAGGLTLPLIDKLGHGVKSVGIFRTMTIYSLIGGGLLLLTFFNIKEKESGNSSLTLRKALLSFAENKAWKMFALNILFMWGAYFIQQAALVFFYSYYVQESEIIGTVVIITAVATIAGTTCTPLLIRKTGKRNLFLYSSTIYVLGVIIMIVAERSIAGLLTGTIVAAIGFGLRHAVYFTMQADLSDYSENISGNTLTGLIAAGNQFVGRIAMTAAGAITGMILSIGGYKSGLQQDQHTLLAIRLNYLYIPAALVMISILIMSFYRYDGALKERCSV